MTIERRRTTNGERRLARVDRRSRGADAFIAFNRPSVVGREMHHVASTITHSNISGDGVYTKACQDLLESAFGIDTVLLVTSCTAALEMAVALAGVGPGDEVIVPSYTFVSTASAITKVGATPVFVDIRSDSLNLDAGRVEAAITPRTRALLPIHYAGVAAEMTALGAIADQYGLMVIEDAAQGVDAYSRGRALGSIAPLGCYSFHETKNVICGEGGALCINDPALLERAEIMRDKGTNRRQFSRGQAEKYTWVDVGSSHVLAEMLAAFLLGQLEVMDRITARRGQLWDRYHEGLADLGEKVGLPAISAHVESNHHIFHLMARSKGERDALIAWLAERGIQAVFHYVPLHSSPMGERHGRVVGSMVNTDKAGSCLLRLPLYHDLSEAEVDRVIAAVRAFYDTVGE